MTSTIITKNSSTASAVPLAADLTQGELAVNVTDKKLYTKNASGTVVQIGGTGDVVGPASATANGIALFNSTTGKLIKDSAASDGLIYGLTVGRGAGAVATTTAVGASALAANSSGGNNVAIGYQAGLANSTGGQSTLIGSQAGLAGTDLDYVTAVGYQALSSITSGDFNTALGAQALKSNTSGANLTAVGYQAGYTQTTSSSGTAIGYQAGYSATGNSLNESVFVGHQTGYYQTGGSNTAIGHTAFQGSTTPANNTGYYNTAVGIQALKVNTSGINNTALGYQAGFANTTGYDNTFIGFSAGGTNTTGYFNTFVGDYSGYSHTTGVWNTCIGKNSGYALTTGSKNTLLGGYNGNQGGLDARTRNNEVILSDGDGNIMYRANGTATSNRWVNNDGTQFYPGTDNVISLGFSSNRWTTVYATTGTINTSDANQKQDIANLDDAEKRVAVAIKSLIKKYRFKDAVAKKGDAARIHIGAVAQEVQAAFVAEGLDPARYALFCSDTWYEVDGKPSNTAIEPYTADTPNSVQVTQLGLRYEELLAFVIAAL